MPAVFALLASLVWGSSDFAGGTLTRRFSSLGVVFAGVCFAVAVLLLGVVVVRPPWGGYQVYGALAGVAGALALVCFYRAMAAGPMSLVAPLSAVGTVIPVLWAVVGRGEAVRPAQGAGMVLAFAGVLLACGPRVHGAPRVARSTFLYTLVAAIGFGCYFLFVALGSGVSVYGTLVAQRCAGLLVLVPLVVRGRGGGGGLLGGGRLAVRDVPVLAFVGLGDLAANGLYGLAARGAGAGLAVVTVLASLYPVATTVLAWLVHGERLRAVQNVGVLAALGGVLLLNA